MKHQSNKKKIFKKVLLIVASFFVVLIVSGYFLLKYRIRDIIETAVYLATNDTYKIDIKTVSFSIKDATIQMRNAALTSTSQQDTVTKYGLTIPEFYIGLSSWKPLLFEKKIAIDSLHMIDPAITVFEGTVKQTAHQHTAFTMSSVVQDLNSVLKKLAIKKLTVENAAIIYRFADNTNKPLNIKSINVSILNFSDDNNDRNSFLAAEDIDIRIGKQHWVLPGTRNELSFSNLHFSGSKQLFEIDSCSFKAAATEKSNAVDVEADKFLFNTTSLTSLYLENKLLIDTLECRHPVLHLATEAKTQHTDTAHVLSESLKHLFTNLHFRYINIIEGQLSLLQKNNNKQTAYTTEKTDLRLYDLDINTMQSPSFGLGNIELELDTIQFFTPDSLYVLNVDDFSIYNNDLVCRNAAFIPATRSLKNGGLQITLPLFVLKNIGLQELLQKKLKADYAEFDDPEIFVTGSGIAKSDTSKKVTGIDGLYTALHSFSSLMDVQAIYIKNGNLHFKTNAIAKTSADAKNLNAEIKLNDLFKSGSLIDIKKALAKLNIEYLQFNSPKLKATLKQLDIKGALQENHVKTALITLASGAKLYADGMVWKKLDWDLLYNSGKIYADSVNFKNLQIQYKELSNTAKSKTKSKVSLRINNFSINKLDAAITLLNGTDIKTKGSNINVSGLADNTKGLQWEDIKAKFTDAAYTKPGTKVSIGLAEIDKQMGTRLEQVNVASNSGRFILPEIKLATTISNTTLSDLQLQYLIINDPQVTINAKENNTARGGKDFAMPFNLSAGKMEVNRAAIKYNSQAEDSLQFSALINITIDSLHMLKQGNEPLQFNTLKLHLSNTELINKKLVAKIPAADINLTKTALQKSESGTIGFLSNVAFQWTNAAVAFRDTSKKILHAENISGSLDYPSWKLGGKEKNTIINVAEKLKLTNGSLYYATAASTITADKINWNGDEGDLQVEAIHITPNMSRDTFFKAAQWQKDYMTMALDKVNVNNIDLAKYRNDTTINIKEIIVQGASLNTSKDKNIPFQHGIEKLMPTKLIAKIKTALHIGTVLVKDASITANEISTVTQREGSILLVSVNAEIKNITNRPGANDSLSIRTTGVLFDHYLRSLQYKESYADSLSGFRMTLKMAPMNLTALSKVTNPLAAVNIEKGRSDTLIARVAGNKYAAFGEMKFYYKDLKVRMLDHKDTTRKNFLLSFENMLANKLVVRTNNKKSSKIFFVRDPEKFVFNYWIKSTFSGVLTSAGVKGNKKYEKKYKGVKDRYSLPAGTD